VSDSAGFLLDPHAGVLDELLRRAAGEGLYLIARAVDRRAQSVSVVNGRTEEVASSSNLGLGLSVFTAEGTCAFGAVDGLAPSDALVTFRRTADTARVAARMEATPTTAFLSATPNRSRIPQAGRRSFQSVRIPEAETRARGLDEEMRGRFPGLSTRTSLSFEREEWRVVRSDGTQAAWAVTRFVSSQAMTAAGSDGEDGSFTCRATLSSPHFDALEDDSARRVLQLRAEGAARRALALPAAGRFSSAGPVPLLIDYALAKGLAHEAFGHAAEADSFRSSVLARDGRFRRGERVGRDGVSVIDEPLRGDHADQPISANGQPRRRVEIVRSGVLHDALTDLFAADGVGGASNGCERAQSYRHPPIPRMSNIRIELENARPLAAPFEEMGPEEIRRLVGDAGLLDRYPRVVYLSGYTGGQVNPVRGDFLFNCQALYELTGRSVTLHRPSAFRGSILGALASLADGFGPLHLDAIGTCGKWGQSVPSSGGSHAFVLLEPNPNVGVGA
jgi:TldD protein